MPRYESPGIYLETKGVSGSSVGPDGLLGYKHLYLVFRRADGTTEVIRGGHSLGKLEVETGRSMNESADANPEFEGRTAKRLAIPGDRQEAAWKAMREKAETLGTRPLRYDSYLPGDDVPEQNSNSVIRAALEAGGVEPVGALPPGIKPADVPGFENNLENPSYFDPHDMGDPAATRGIDDQDIANIAPEMESLRASLMPAEDEADDLDTLLLKSPDILTGDEAAALGRHYWSLASNDPRRAEADARRRDFYVLTYGDGPAEVDAAGRLVQPALRRAVPTDPSPIKTPDGGTLAEGIGRVVAKVTDAARDDGAHPAVKALQTGLSMLGERLKPDGDAGPKTRAALIRAVAKKGPAKTEEALALGRFQGFAKAERDSGGSASGLKDTVARTVQPLFGDAAPSAAAETLQESLNDLGEQDARERQAPEPAPLFIDGDIGPKTTDAFRSSLALHGPGKLTERYGRMFGFG